MTYNQKGITKAHAKKQHAAEALGLPAGVVLTSIEARECQRIKAFVAIDKEHAQTAADIWMRSAPTDKAAERRKAAVKALGLSDKIKFL